MGPTAEGSLPVGFSYTVFFAKMLLHRRALRDRVAHIMVTTPLLDVAISSAGGSGAGRPWDYITWARGGSRTRAFAIGLSGSPHQRPIREGTRQTPVEDKSDRGTQAQGMGVSVCTAS